MKERSTLSVLVLVFVILAAGIVATGWLFYRSQQDSVKTQAERKLTAIADLKASQFLRWRTERLADAGVLYNNLAFSDLVRHNIERPQDSTLQEELRSWISRIQVSYHYDLIALLDAAGNTRMSVPDSKEPLSSITIRKAREALRSGKLTFDDFYRNKYSQKIYLRLFVPIHDGKDVEHPIGMVVLRINPNTYLYPFIQRWPTPAKTAETLLVRREGNEVVFLNELKYWKNVALALRLPLDTKDLPAVKAVLGHEGAVKGIDYRGVPVLTAVCAVPDSPWFLVAKIDAAEVYAPMWERLWLMVLLTGALLFGSAAILGLIWRRRQLSFYREKYDVECKYRAILEISADGIMIADVETRMFKYANLAACQMLGYPEDELTTMGVADIIPKDALQDTLAKFESQARGEKPLVTDIPCLRKDGTIVYADINAANIILDGRVHLVGVFRDITERKRAEKELKRIEWMISKPPSSAIRMTHRDSNGDQGYGSLVDLNSNGIILKSVGKDALADIVSYYLNMMETSSAVYEKNGDYACGVFSSRWCQLMDRASRKLCATDDNVKALNSGKWLCHESCWTRCSKEAIAKRTVMDIECNGGLRLYAVPIFAGDEVVGSINFGYGDPPKDPAKLRELADLYQVDYGELRRVANSYNSRPAYIVDLMKSRLYASARLIGALVDRNRADQSLQAANTELRSTNAALTEANQLAESATRAKSAFLANMSHEIRTPMTSILGYSELIAESSSCCTICPSYQKCETRTASHHHLQAVRRNAEHLMELISSILDLSKIEAGKFQIEPTRCSPVQLVAEVVSLMRTQAAAKQLKLKAELTGLLPETVLTDPLRLRQVLVNLVGNAIKFTDQGEVRITARMISDSGPPRLRFDVSDTGVGMNEEQVRKLFQPFSQMDSSSTRKFGGAGLGLALSKHLAKALGGSIEVHSTPGKGSTFSVTIDPGPLDGIRMVRGAREAVVQPPPTAAPAGAGKTKLHGRILLAEDGLDNQRLLSLLLRKAGAQVTAVEDGQAAIEAALAAREAGKPFDVILMDMQMPVLDGYEATRQLRSRDYRGPIIALTAHAMGPDRQKCLEAGCDDYLSKPIERHELLQIVARHMQAFCRNSMTER